MGASNKPKLNEQLLLRLTDAQQAHPASVFVHFFECYHLKDVRELLWDWLLTALGSDNGVYAKGRDRSNLIFLYEKLETMAEAAWVLHKQQPPSPKRKGKKKK